MRSCAGGARFALLLTLMLALAGCGGLLRKKAPQESCPVISVVPEASQITKFLIGGEGDPNSITFHAKFGRTELICYYEKGELQVEIGVEFHTERGPADRSLSGEFEYFVALGGPDQEIFDKRRFVSGIEFSKFDPKLTVAEPIQQVIPLHAGESGADFRIFVGFQLTPEQLQYNRGN